MATGDCFGISPAQGTLPNQQTVSGYLGNGLVNTYLNGDGGAGTLTSPSFIIQRKYIKFLIGAGNHRGQTCINLIVGDQVVASSVGMGDREALDWLQWNVSAYTNQTAQLQIVDSSTSGWGHVNVDQIMQTDTSLPSVFVASQHYLNLPIQTGATKHLVELIQNGLVVREMNVELATTVTNFWAFMDLTPFQGQELLVRVDSQLATPNQLATYFVQTNTIITSTPIYQESLRPLYHFTSRRGWNNDANGMVYFNGQYHLCYQHNPYGWAWDNMHWGNAVSTDMVHWTELPEAMYPDYLGTEYSGSAVVDCNDSAGFGTNALVAFICSAGGENRMSSGQPFTQTLAYSLDQGQTWTKYTNNPIIPNVVGDNRDPKVIWYAPGNKWVMALYLSNNNFGFFSSTNLINWTQTSTFTLTNGAECPELFPLALDGNTNNLEWIFWAGGGVYAAGQFDGNSFTQQYGTVNLNHGNDFYAAQTFNDIPAADGRRIMMAWANAGSYLNMPFNGGMTFPIQLTLVTTAGTPTMYANPVNELSLLRTATNSWPAQSLVNGTNVMAGTTGEACEVDVQFKPGTATSIIFSLRGTTVTYNCQSQQISCQGVSSTLNPVNGIVTLQMLVDRGSLEIFGDNGLLYMPVSVPPVAGALPISCMAIGSGVQLVTLSFYNLGSAWFNSSNLPIPNIITAPAGSTANLGGSVSFGVTAGGVGPLDYQWYDNGQAIAGGTNSTLNVFPVSGTNLNYDVVVSNAGGSVTSSVAPLTVLGPYAIAYWRMESQITAPNNAGTPTYVGVADSDTNTGQGIYTMGTLPAAIEDLITFNGLTGGPVTLSTNVAPTSMFVNSHTAGNYSYNAGSISNVDGCLLFPQDQYGDELDFTGPFTIEMFFKTDSNQSGMGKMELFCQGTDGSGYAGALFRYGIDVNEAGAGAVRFAVVNSSLGQTNVLDLAGMNYADGKWHYLQAVCDSLSGQAGQLRLTIVNTDGTEAQATNNLPGNFLPLPAGDEGNAFMGRYNYPDAADGGDPRTFVGEIDEVQVISGVEPDGWRVGKIPTLDNHPRISGVEVGTNGVSLQWTGAAVNQFLVQWVSQLSNAWQNIATVPGANSFTDTNPGHFTNPAGYYRIVAL